MLGAVATTKPSNVRNLARENFRVAKSRETRTIPIRLPIAIVRQKHTLPACENVIDLYSHVTRVTHVGGGGGGGGIRAGARAKNESHCIDGAIIASEAATTQWRMTGWLKGGRWYEEGYREREEKDGERETLPVRRVNRANAGKREKETCHSARGAAVTQNFAAIYSLKICTGDFHHPRKDVPASNLEPSENPSTRGIWDYTSIVD